MACRNIVQVGNEILRKKSLPIEEINDEIITLLDDMKETLTKADGVGLAAVQVGVLKRIFIVSVEEDYFEFINPVMIKQAGSQTDREGCLSIVKKSGLVERPNKVVIKAFNRQGQMYKLTAYGFLARAICHEYDHLDGILYTDKATDIRDEEWK